MSEMIRKIVSVEVKELGDRVLEIAGSTEDKDRAGDILKASGWKLKHFKNNPVFMWAHNYNQPPIGKALRVWIDKEAKELMFKIEFAPPETYEFADTIYKLYLGGFLHAVSVGFIALDWEGKDEENPNPKWEGNVFTSQELLELSAVPVPANAQALVNARDQGLITVKEFEAVTHTEEPLLITSGDSPDPEEEPEPANQPRIISQEALADDMDYVLQAIKEVGISEEQMPAALELASAIIERAPGSDIPVDILSKVGAVLNIKNEERLLEIEQRLQEILDSTRPTEEEGEKQVEPELDPTARVKHRVQVIAEVTNVVIAKLQGKRIR